MIFKIPLKNFTEKSSLISAENPSVLSPKSLGLWALDKLIGLSYNWEVKKHRKQVINRLFDNAILLDISEAEVVKLLKPVRYVDDCWIRGDDSTIYTSIYTKKFKDCGSHRVSLALYKGEILKHFACHTCDVKACINPEHLTDQNQMWNVYDSVAKDRQRYNGGQYKKEDKQYRAECKDLQHLLIRLDSNVIK